MDRAAHIAALKLGAMHTDAVVAFLRGLHRRLPTTGDAAVAARESIGRRLATLDAETLGRDVDHRVPVEIDETAERLADRLARFTSADWNRRVGDETLAERARATVGEISADLHAAGSDDDPADD